MQPAMTQSRTDIATPPTAPASGAVPLLTIVIPAYNEESRLPSSLSKIDAFLRQQPYQAEVLVVENGRRGGTSGIVERFCADHPYVRLLHSVKGKGAAVQVGMLAAAGDYALICDADLAMPIAETAKLLSAVQNGFDVAIASREGEGAVRFAEPYYRHLMGRVFNTLVRILAIPSLQDTQCGFKLFRRAVAHDVFARQTMGGWAFDVEVLAIALRRGYKVVEVPIHWYFMTESKISALRDTVSMLREVFKVRLNVRRGLYD